MGESKMIWSKAAHEKLEEELDIYIDAALFIIDFEPPNEILKVASDKIKAVTNDLNDIIYSVNKQNDDVSLIINEFRQKVESQLQYICDNFVSQAFQDFLIHFKQQLAQLDAAAATAAAAAAAADTGTSKKKGKRELRQQKDYERKLNVCLDKQDTVKQFTRDYYKTVRFMERFIFAKGAPKIERVLIDAFHNISDGYQYMYNIYGYEEVDKWYHLDVSQLIKEYKSKMENGLKDICNNVSDPTIKEAFSRHLTEVTAQNQHAKDEKRMSSEQKMSVIQKKKKKKSTFSLGSELYSLKSPLRLTVENHSQCCFKKSPFDCTHEHLTKNSTPKGEEQYP